MGSSLPCYNGKEVNAAMYTEFVVEGFQKAYEYYLSNRQMLYEEMKIFFTYESRLLVRHTQQYSMYLNTSLYPEFLESSTKRKLFLHVLDKSPIAEQLHRSEREAMYQMDIPIFNVVGRKVFDGNRKEYPDYLQQDIFEQWNSRLQEFCADDRNYQIKFIRLSMSMLEEQPMKQVQEKEFSSLNYKVIKNEIIIRHINDLCKEAIIYGDDEDVNWSSLRFYNNKSWSFVPMGMYLYDGISGIAVCLACLLKKRNFSEGRRIFEILKKKMCAYTDQVYEGKRPVESTCTGALVGEGSIVKTYLLLYQITGESVYLEYANKHYEVLAAVAEKDRNYDFLSGYAGAIGVIAKLYRLTKCKNQLEKAVELGERLWKAVQRQEKGVGVLISGMKKPLAGMAHGNSGLILAYANLLEETGESFYCDRIEELLVYENTLYSEKIHNWRDLRNASEEEGALNGWCHGAAGILISRMKIKQLSQFSKSEVIENDIFRCVDSLEQLKFPESICLCHGLAGLRGIISEVLKLNEKSELRQLRDRLLRELVFRIYHGEMPAYEQYNYSLMQGITGVIMLLESDTE